MLLLLRMGEIVKAEYSKRKINRNIKGEEICHVLLLWQALTYEVNVASSSKSRKKNLNRRQKVNRGQLSPPTIRLYFLHI